MAYQTPKTDWALNEGISTVDLERMENNILTRTHHFSTMITSTVNIPASDSAQYGADIVCDYRSSLVLASVGCWVRGSTDALFRVRLDSGYPITATSTYTLSSYRDAEYNLDAVLASANTYKELSFHFVNPTGSPITVDFYSTIFIEYYYV